MISEPQCIALRKLPLGVIEIDVASHALQAIHDAGYAVVPREPTGAMNSAGYRRYTEFDRQGYVAWRNVLEIWDSMIQASQPKTEEG